MANSVDDGARTALVECLAGLSNNNGQPDLSSGWNLSSDPCFLNASALCNVQSLATNPNVLNFDMNNNGGEIQSDISNCNWLTHLLLSGNQFTGNLPDSLAMLC
ncbi:hypothetical protein DITRI_Ditri16bG0127500 [Diplodiscus trichospermus]